MGILKDLGPSLKDDLEDLLEDEPETGDEATVTIVPKKPPGRFQVEVEPEVIDVTPDDEEPEPEVASDATGEGDDDEPDEPEDDSDDADDSDDSDESEDDEADDEAPEPKQMAPAVPLTSHIREFTPEDIRGMADLHKSMMKVTLTTHRWSARVKDDRIAQAGAAAGSADDSSVTAYKSLVAGAEEEVRRINKLIDAAKTTHYSFTLPWSMVSGQESGKRRQGPRVLPNGKYFEYIEAMAKHTREVKEAIEEFVPKYETIKDTAKQHLGTYFDESEYPPKDSIKDRFGIKFSFEPIPSSDQFKGANLPDEQAERLAERLNEQMAKMLNNAMQDLWGKLYKAISHMAERLADPESRFHGSLVTNVDELADMLKHCNISGDKRLDELYKQIKARLAAQDPKDLRKNPEARKAVAEDAKKLAETMATFTQE